MQAVPSFSIYIYAIGCDGFCLKGGAPKPSCTALLGPRRRSASSCRRPGGAAAAGLADLDCGDTSGRRHVYEHICSYTHTCDYAETPTCIFTCSHSYTLTYSHTYTHAQTFECTCTPTQIKRISGNTHVCVHVNVFRYTSACMSTSVKAYKYTCIHMYVCLLCIQLWLYICLYTSTHTYPHMYVYMNMCRHIAVCVYVCVDTYI